MHLFLCKPEKQKRVLVHVNSIYVKSMYKHIGNKLLTSV